MVKRIYDLKPSKEDLRVRHFSAEYFKTSQLLPSLVDYRPLQSPIKDQADLGYCFAFATVGLREYLENKNKQKFVSLSELFLGYKTKQREGTVGEDNGASIADALWALNKFGTCPESIDPYIPAMFGVAPNVVEELAASKYKITSYSSIPNLTGLKTVLAEGNVAVVGISVYSSFESEEVAQTGIVPMPNKQTEQCLGGHAVLAVGYDDAKQHIIVKNSWGANWGDKGYFYLPYAFVQDPELMLDMYTGK